MENIIIEKVEAEERIHEFYCDKCGKFIKKSYECEDGYYEEPKMSNLRAFCDSFGWLTLKGNYCEKCMKEIENKIHDFLIENGMWKKE